MHSKLIGGNCCTSSEQATNGCTCSMEASQFAQLFYDDRAAIFSALLLMPLRFHHADCSDSASYW